MTINKAVISNRIYLPNTQDLFSNSIESLKYVIPSVSGKAFGGKDEVICDVTRISDSVFSIPVARTDLIPEGFEIIDKRVTNPIEYPESLVTLRKDQQDIVDMVRGNCIIVAKPGWGKTFTALHIAKELGQKTLVVVNTLALMAQWKEEVYKVFGERAGTISSSVVDVEDRSIVVSNVQTLNKVIHKYNKDFGLVFADECHRVPAKVFKKIIDASYAKYKIGLSATPYRKDGKHIILPDYFSSDFYEPEVDTAMPPKIKIIKLSNIFWPGGKAYADRVTSLLNNKEYLNVIIDIAKTKIKQGHKVLILTDRVKATEYLGNHIPNVKYVLSYTESREAIHNEVRNGALDGIVGTTSIYKEGISVNNLSCLILTSGINNNVLLEQIIGRVTRPAPNKLQPEIIDLVPTGNTPKAQARERLRYYTSREYEVEVLDV